MFYRSFGTQLAIRNTITFTKSSPEHAFQVGQELCLVFTTLARHLQSNDSFNIMYCYNFLSSQHGWSDTFISSVMTQYVDPSRFFSMLNVRLLCCTKKGILQAFFRGYFMGYLVTYNIPNEMFNTRPKWFVLYDCHYHYLLFLFNRIRSWHVVDTLQLKLNDSDDMYSFNEETDIMSYKLVVEKKENDLIDPVYVLLEWLYNGCTINDTYSDDDRAMFTLMGVIRS